MKAHEEWNLFKKVVEKAKNNGFNYHDYWSKNPDIYTVIFSHKFAQAFWPDQDDVSFIESPIKELVVYEKQKSSWRYHLKQMALEPEPLKYLRKFL